MTNSLLIEIGQRLDIYLQENCKFKTKLLLIPKGSSFPRVILEEISNRNSGKDVQLYNSITYHEFELNVFAKSVVHNGTQYSELMVALEIAKCIDNFMRDEYMMLKTMGQPTPNFEDDVYRYTMRFSCKTHDQNGLLIR